MSTHTAYKAVDADLFSPFVPWPELRIAYVVGDTFDARGLQGIPLQRNPVVRYPDPPIDIRDPRNAWRGILAYSSLDSWWLKVPTPFPPSHLKYLQLEYDDADVLAFNDLPDKGLLGIGQLSLARVTVVAQVSR